MACERDRRSCVFKADKRCAERPFQRIAKIVGLRDSRDAQSSKPRFSARTIAFPPLSCATTVIFLVQFTFTTAEGRWHRSRRERKQGRPIDQYCACSGAPKSSANGKGNMREALRNVMDRCCSLGRCCRAPARDGQPPQRLRP